MKKLLIAIAMVLASCNGTDITTPDPIDIPIPDVPGDDAPPPLARVDAPFSWEHYQGFTAFALGKPGQTEEDIRDLYSRAMQYGWNTARICSETEFWDGSRSYLPTKPRDAERLDWLLQTIATIPGAQVLLIGDCTLKRQVPLEEARAWARVVAETASSFRNVAVETHNEFANCRGRKEWGGSAAFCPGKIDVAEHVRIYRAAGIEYVTADDRLHPDDFPGDIGFRLANVGAWPADFHPERSGPYNSQGSPDPWRRQLRLVYERNGLFLLSETVALGDVSGSCSGLRTCDLGRIQKYIDECAIVDFENGERGCKFTFHSEALLGGESAGRWAQAK
jgi:hypothetical protein